MRPASRADALGVALFLVTALSPALAQGQRPVGDGTASPSGSHGPLTGKERLGEKWMDEQRIDNCKVPLDKRGMKPRPEVCS